MVGEQGIRASGEYLETKGVAGTGNAGFFTAKVRVQRAFLSQCERGRNPQQHRYARTHTDLLHTFLQQISANQLLQDAPRLALRPLLRALLFRWFAQRFALPFALCSARAFRW